MSTDYGRLSKNELAADVGNAIDTLGANNYAQCADIMKFLFDEIPHATAQAVAIEREATLVYLGNLLLALDRLNIANPGHGYDREAFRLSIYIDGIRSGEHVKP